jgi:hypothetical protein
MQNNHIQATKSSLETRIEFKNYFGIDILEAAEIIKQRTSETEREWHQTLVKHGVIK